MKAHRILAALVVVVLAQWACGDAATPAPAPYQPQQPTAAPQPTASTDTSIGTVSNIYSRVRAGATDALRDILGTEPLENNHGVQVTDGGKARLQFPGPVYLLLYNQSNVEGVVAEIDQASSNRLIASRLIRGGVSGHVEPGQRLVIDLALGRRVTVLGTDFFVVYNEFNGYTTVGKFNGTLIVSIPGQNDVYLDSEMVDIAPDGNTLYYPLPFGYQEFEQAATERASALDGLDFLRALRGYPPQGAPPTPVPTPTFTPLPEPRASIWLAGGCDRQYDAGVSTQIMAQSNRDGWVSVLLGNEWLWKSVPVYAGQQLTLDWVVPEWYGAQTLTLQLDLGDRAFPAAQCNFTIWDSTPPPAPAAYGPGNKGLPPEQVKCPVVLSWSQVQDAGGIQNYDVAIDDCSSDYASCTRMQELKTSSTSADISSLMPTFSAGYYRWAVSAVDKYGNYSSQSDWLYFKNFGGCY